MEPWSILGANLVAAVVMLGLLFLHHQRSLKEVMTSAE
jgi:CBS-domain-containing membrane protein